MEFDIEAYIFANCDDNFWEWLSKFDLIYLDNMINIDIGIPLISKHVEQKEK